MALNPLFSVEGSTVVQAHAVAYGATVDLEIQSLTGIEQIAWSIIGTSKSTEVAPTITPAGTPAGATASFVMPSDPGDGLGRSFLVKLLVSSQQEGSVVAYRVVGAVNSNGDVPIALGEENHRHATHGYTDVLNRALIANVTAAGGTGQLLYNNAGSLDGASGITVVGSETGLQLAFVQPSSGTAPGSGLVRGTNNTVIVTARTTGGADMNLVSTDSANSFILGEDTDVPKLVLRCATGGTYEYLIGGTIEYVVSATAFDFNGNNLQEMGNLDHDGTTAGFYGTTPIAKQTGVAVTAGGVHAALVNLGLISA